MILFWRPTCILLLQEVELPDNAFIFTTDATFVYTNIDTDVALKIIPEYLFANEEKFGYDAETLTTALHIVFCNNHFRFGDKYAKQTSGTAMGKRPALPG